MTATHILALIIMLIPPVCTALTGFKRMTSNAAFGARGGYRSERAMVSPSAWAFAQKTNGLYYVIGGIITAIFSVLLTIALPADRTAVSMIIYALVFACAWIALNLVLMVLTETAIMHKHF